MFCVIRKDNDTAFFLVLSLSFIHLSEDTALTVNGYDGYKCIVLFHMRKTEVIHERLA
jgi:hypothetical protein